VPHRLVSVTPGEYQQLADTAARSDDLVVYTLRLDSVTLQDEGEYTCQVPSLPSLIQRHRVVINGQSNNFPDSATKLLSFEFYFVFHYTIATICLSVCLFFQMVLQGQSTICQPSTTYFCFLK